MKKKDKWFLLVINFFLLWEPVFYLVVNFRYRLHYISAIEIFHLVLDSGIYDKLIIVILVNFGMYFFRTEIQSIKESPSNQQINALRQRLVEENAVEDKRTDILELMLNNMSEIQAYYAISKQHAWLSFVLSVVFCILGFLLFSQALAADIDSQQPVIVGAIGGTISEIFAGTALLVHKSSLKQLNRYYLALHENERFLSTVNLLDRLSDEKREDALIKIIDNSLTNITSLVKEFSEEK